MRQKFPQQQASIDMHLFFRYRAKIVYFLNKSVYEKMFEIKAVDIINQFFFFNLTATLFLELWKRYSAEITHRWDLTGFDVQEEHPRPQYLARLSHVKRLQVNIVTNTMEPQVPFWKMRLPATILSFSVVILLVINSS